jgi:serine/threonine protein kinase/predicted ATPase
MRGAGRCRGSFGAMNSAGQKRKLADAETSEPTPSPTFRTCSICGRKLPAGNPAASCPVCLLRIALDPAYSVISIMNEGDIAESGVGAAAANPRRFGHYEIQTHPNGSLCELGHGAMGITFKAIDVNLRIPVTLKVLNLGLFQEELARQRFFREARSAAIVRHPNVASVYHLGFRGREIFYAMEFVEGETLEHLIKRSGRLEVKLALEIATQIASGLAEVHKQNLVHRDIKPSNIIVRVEPGGAVIAKIIDLGLAKAIDEPDSKTAISILGAFAGTPIFASPEQFAGLGVDIRSDLYSLGVTLWVMLTGQVPFGGSLAEVMYQHQHALLPLEQLKGLPQPVIVLLEVLLDKDPGRRFQTPVALLKAIPTITGAIDARCRITRQSLQNTPFTASRNVTRRPQAIRGPEKISLARLPVTGSDVFGREEDIAFLNDAWENPRVNIVTIVAWAGVGKSTLVNHWLRRMATDHYRSAELIFGWSFYRQGSGDTSSADEFLDAALTWFCDPDPRLGTAWEKGERLAKLMSHRRTLLVLDGLEPLQNPPGPQEGRVREPSLRALLRELAAFNTGLCIITTRTPVADIADHEGTSALHRGLEQLSSYAGAQLLRALGVKGNEEKLREASGEFSGHCLSLTLLGSYLTDAYSGDIRYRKEVSENLAQDVRQGVHVRRVMESYKTWLGEGPELSVLRMLGLFDRPTDEKALGVLLKPPAIPRLTESLIDLSPIEWRTILAKLRRARLLAGEDPHNPGHLDTHPLVREYFGEQLRSQQTDAWKECNRRLFRYYRTVAPELPNSFREMEPLFSAVICGCNGGLFREALHEIYLPRIQRGNAHFAANVLGARGALLLVLAHFFEDGRWGSPVETGVEGQSLTAEDQLFILMQAALYLMATRGSAAPEMRICYERAESLCHSLNRPLLLYVALMGQWRYSLNTDKLTATMQLGEGVYSLAQEHNDSYLMMGACRALAVTFYYLGDFETARQYALRGLQIWRSGSIQSCAEEYISPVVSCLCFKALSEWHLGDIASCPSSIAEALSLAKELNDMVGLASALHRAALLAHLDCNPAEVERYASALIELSTRHNFGYWLAAGAILRGWARSASGDAAEGISWIEGGIRDYRATGSIRSVPFYLRLKAEVLYLTDRIPEALEAITQAEALVERNEERWHYAELLRLRGVFLAAMGARKTQTEDSFCAAIRIAREQKAISLLKRAEASYAVYRGRKRKKQGDAEPEPGI